MLTKADIRLVRSLADKRARTDEGLFVAEGGKLIGELRASTLRIRRIYALDGVFAGEDVTTVSPKEMERLSLLKTPSDSLALVEIPRRRLDPAKLRRSLVLALDDVQNPGNLGTIVRLADWFGIGDVVCSEATADCFNPKVVQATMGARSCACGSTTATSKPIWRPNAPPAPPIYGTFLEGDDIYRTQLTPTGIVLMGNEGRGVTPACAAQVTRKLFIPPYPRRAARHRIAQRGHGHGHRLRRIPPTGECRTVRRPQAGTMRQRATERRSERSLPFRSDRRANDRPAEPPQKKTERAYPVQGAGRDVIPPPGKRCAVKKVAGRVFATPAARLARFFSAEAARLCEKILTLSIKAIRTCQTTDSK